VPNSDHSNCGDVPSAAGGDQTLARIPLAPQQTVRLSPEAAGVPVLPRAEADTRRR
jgi:hypothetical protein